MATAARYKRISTAVVRPFMETITLIVILLITVMLISQGRDKEVIIPLLALFSTSALRLLPLIKEILKNYTTLRFALYSVNPVYDDLKLLKNISCKNNPDEVLSFENEVKVKNIFYKYPTTEEYVINNVSLEIPKGSVIGLVGATGAGKTTLVDILLGLLTPEKGVIEVDNVNIFDNIKAWQKNLGYIPQDIFLCDNTFRGNIAFGERKKNIDDERLWQAIKDAQLEEFVKTLPKGVNTVIGERGVRLSGGQRQRVGIARALYHNPEILVMDEATAALDNTTESYIIKELEYLKGKRTIIMIAHRLSTVKNCDKLFYIKDGVITKTGNYNDLLEMEPEFKKMAGLV